jgi:hypothetical protein
LYNLDAGDGVPNCLDGAANHLVDGPDGLTRSAGEEEKASTPVNANTSAAANDADENFIVFSCLMIWLLVIVQTKVFSFFVWVWRC